MNVEDAELASLDEAVARDAGDVALRLRRGARRLHEGMHDAALADFDAALALSPRDTSALSHRALAWLALADAVKDGDEEDDAGFRDEALADLDRWIALDPQSAVAHERRGVALHGARCFEEAVDDLSRALELGAAEGWIRVWLAASACHGGRPEVALNAADAAIAADATDSEAHYWRGVALLSLDDWTAAIAAFGTALALDPGSTTKLTTRAAAYVVIGEHAQAEADLTRAIELAPLEPSHLLDRAHVWTLLGDERRADEDFARSALLQNGETMTDMAAVRRKLIYLLLRDHFGEIELDLLAVHERQFPRRVRADIQHALDALPSGRFTTLAFTGMGAEYEHTPVSFSRISKRSRHDPIMASAPQWEDLDVGTGIPVRCAVSGLWLLEAGGVRLAMLLIAPAQHGPDGCRFQIAVPPGATALADELFGLIEKAVAEARCYRGKVLSLETCRTDYAGRATGIAVHTLPAISREDVILPPATLDLLERNVFDFVERRERLRALRMSTKKGLLFYGPPGTGKTHTIRYLATTLVGQTTLLVTADQIALLDEYMTLARLLQPAIVVIEDVDLIARNREDHETPGTESLLNRLLNEMDGLRPDVDVLFILTTNRPEALEPALASRPGRIDQAIEFPLPDASGRRRLAGLYAGGLEVPDTTLDAIVRRTEGASASFIRELMRRSAQFMLARGGDRTVEPGDVESAIREMVEAGGSLNRALLGAGAAAGSDASR